MLDITAGIKSIKKTVSRFKEFGILTAFLVLALILTISTPTFFQLANLILVVRWSAYTGILALGAVFMLSQGDIDLSVGSIYNIVALYIVVVLEMGLPVGLAVLTGLFIGMLCGFINISLSIMLKIPMLIITLGTMNIFRGLGLVIYGGEGRNDFPLDNFLFKVLGEKIGQVPFSVIALFILAAILFFVFGYTKFGIHVRSIGGNVLVARAMSIRINRTRIFSAMINGGLAAIAAILTVGYVRTAVPTFGTGYELMAIAAAIIGGTALSGGSGSIIGAVIGALILSLIVNGMAHLGVPYYWSGTVTGMVIITAVALDYFSNRKKLLK